MKGFAGTNPNATRNTSFFNLGIVLQRLSKASSSLTPLTVYEPVPAGRVAIGMPAMPNKALRILIADTQHTHRIVLERLFNQQGYFRIVPVSDVQALLTLVEYGSEPFDLVVVNAGLAEGALDLHDFILYNPQVRHAMLYDVQQIGLSPVPAVRRSSLHLSHAPLPDLAALRRVMERVDPPASEPVQPWGRSLRQGRGG